MGCCVSAGQVPVAQLQSIEQSAINSAISLSSIDAMIDNNNAGRKASNPKRFARKQEPKLSIETDTRASSLGSHKSTVPSKPSPTPKLPSCEEDQDLSEEHAEDLPPTPVLETNYTMSEKMERRRSEILQEKAKIARVQSQALEQQVAVQQSRNYKRLYDVWMEHVNVDGVMDMDDLAGALSVFGMVIDTTRSFQRHIFKKFDVDSAGVIQYEDFSATIASFVGSNKDDDALQTLFEVFDIDQDGYLKLEDMARILLTQNQITMVATGQSEKNQVSYTKQQCLKLAKRMVAQYDSSEFNDDKISFEEFHKMMTSRTENDMIIEHMAAPSMDLAGVAASDLLN
mmetsp:Transcript_26095/g.42640  ORF Transcript_26095/g.42640 Transcript_26095/m.42640 type:complete len:342 (-) Transcript_26095:711-1736(-)|eukprot:CAMPEP_0202697398 /NCGR_PEP_ID=MMETSP1385-20130828/10721_1 /ASSEMBLY_ACC=CAM_ASM_000861 /TAXON_ID=933848 /ORGANISM="Elphidium margaritaceum" /LENGTH=341 /DNA_ID=CAMNT_0049353843 /DNA_START=118 /DNA_END=1143 /DNA_ORIENTATION=-